jgi:cell division protein FtsI/penicillin-binding protein 2
VLRGSGARLPTDAEADSAAASPLFDRARFGLYPPGSTFKIVTAAAALEQDPALARTTFTCRALQDGRVGTIVEGHVVRDDPTDPVHGTIAMEEAIVVSCNAYFAQLARRVGWNALAASADRFGIATGNPSAAERPAHLLEAAYGQAHVVASPYQMARVAAAVANAGALPALRWTLTPADSDAAISVFGAATAHTLAHAMRGVVERGTASRLAAVSPPVAGKTGTAQVANQPSHSWFIGYAPASGDGRRIAFAVLLENGGYGGVRAAQLAAGLVAAARDLAIAR